MRKPMPKQSIPSSVLSLFVAQRVFQVCTAALVSNSCAVFLRTIIIAALSLALVGMEVAASAAAPSTCLMGGDLDPTFDGDGKVMTDFSSGFDVAYAVAVQSDGKIVAAGVIGNTQDFAIARYNADGSLDPGFSSDGMTTTDFAGGNDQARSVAIQSDGKIVVAGYAAVGSATDPSADTAGKSGKSQTSHRRHSKRTETTGGFQRIHPRRSTDPGGDQALH